MHGEMNMLIAENQKPIPGKVAFLISIMHLINLPEKCHLVYKMSRENGMSQKQIAAEFCISEKTVEAHIGKALKVLRTGLGQLFL